MGRQKQLLRNTEALPLSQIALSPGTAAPSPEAVERLAKSLKRHGQRHPVLVTATHPTGRKQRALRVIQGQARVLAARKLGWQALEGIVLEGQFRAEIRVIEGLRNGGGDPWTVTDALTRLKTAHGWTQHQLGDLIGKSRDFVTNMLAIANITPETREFIQHNQDGFSLTARHLRFIGRTPPRRQFTLARNIITHRLSTKTLEEKQKGHPRPKREFLRVGHLIKSGGRKSPKTGKDWKKYYRQLNTELLRIDQREAQEMKRLEAQLKILGRKKKMILGEAKEKRRLLKRELQRAARKLAQAGKI